MSANLLRRLPDLVEPAVARTAQTTARPPEPDGRVEVTFPIESIDHAAAVLLSLGAEAEILAPPELRRRVAETVTALAATYAMESRP